MELQAVVRRQGTQRVGRAVRYVQALARVEGEVDALQEKSRVVTERLMSGSAGCRFVFGAGGGCYIKLTALCLGWRGKTEMLGWGQGSACRPTRSLATSTTRIHLRLEARSPSYFGG